LKASSFSNPVRHLIRKILKTIGMNALYMESKEVVESFLNALNADEFELARNYLEDGFTFQGPLGRRGSADEYMKDMEKMRLKYDVKRVFSDSEEVSVLYEINFGKESEPILICGWYKLHHGKIASLRVVFDPRSLSPPQK
jgi:limonene-1,2-epoxide hydrolase